MIKEKIIYGIYDDDDVILNAVKAIRKEGQHINDVYSPFPIHGLDHALGLKPTRLAITSFIYGCTGLSLGLLMMWYMMIQDWPQIIGGKPNFSLSENFSVSPIKFNFILFSCKSLTSVCKEDTNNSNNNRTSFFGRCQFSRLKA